MKHLLLLTLVVSAAFAGCEAQPVRMGQSATVQYGRVRSAQPVRLDSDAGKGALIGGTIGLVAGGGSSPVRNGILGAAVGGMATSAMQGNRAAMEYTVEMTNGATTRIVTDQREIRPGDCVAVERVGQTSNIRRESPQFCEQGNHAAVAAIRDASVSEAVKCESAKAELVRATTSEEADLAGRKIELLCNG